MFVLRGRLHTPNDVNKPPPQSFGQGLPMKLQGQGLCLNLGMPNLNLPV